VFGLLATLQNVATISSWQIVPVLVRGDVTVWPPVPSGCCCWLAIVACCAATGDAAKKAAQWLHVDLVREIPEAKKPRSIPIGNGKPVEQKAVEQKAA
jgi:hypothetical protein